MIPKTIKELHASVTRELHLRKAVYPKRIADGRMKKEAATHELDCMSDLLVLLGWVKTCRQQDGKPLTDLLVRDTIISPAEPEQAQLTLTP